MLSETSQTSFKVDSKKERLLCYSAGILQALLSNPNNNSTSKALVPSSIATAAYLINSIYDDTKLNRILSENNGNSLY